MSAPSAPSPKLSPRRRALGYRETPARTIAGVGCLAFVLVTPLAGCVSMTIERFDEVGVEPLLAPFGLAVAFWAAVRIRACGRATLRVAFAVPLAIGMIYVGATAESRADRRIDPECLPLFYERLGLEEMVYWPPRDDAIGRDGLAAEAGDAEAAARLAAILREKRPGWVRTLLHLDAFVAGARGLPNREADWRLIQLVMPRAEGGWRCTPMGPFGIFGVGCSKDLLPTTVARERALLEAAAVERERVLAECARLGL